jgi:formate dehydrogenase
MIDHPKRITSPMKRVGDSYVPVEYRQMLRELAPQLNAIIDSHGSNAVGAYIGNPVTSNTGTYAFANLFLEAIKTKNKFFVGSLDQNAVHVVNEEMYNHPWAFIQTDIDNCQYLMLVGGNPAVSEFGWVYAATRGWKRILKAKENGSTLVVVDPRKTESAKKASEHLAPIPGTDWALLLAMLHVILVNDWQSSNATLDCVGFDNLKKLALSQDLASLSRRCDIPEETIVRMARDFAHSPSAACVVNTGPGQHATGTISVWLGQVLTLITGNMRRKGGMFHTKGAMNLLKNGAELFPSQHFTSRVRGTASVAGYLPAAEIVDEIETPGEGQIKAFFVIGGNPVLSGPEGEKLDNAFKKLDLLICVDSFQRDSHRHADWLIPTPHFLEAEGMSILVKDLNAQPAAQLLRKAVEKPPGVPYEWQFYRDLTLAMGKPLLLGKKSMNLVVRAFNLIGAMSGDPYNGFSPKALMKELLKKGGATTYSKVERAEHGLLLDEEIDYNFFLDNIPTKDGKVNLVPEKFLQRVRQLLAMPETRANASEYPFLLTGRRRKQMMNSWLTQGSGERMKNKDGDRIDVHPEDAKLLGLEEGTPVRVSSKVGSIEAVLRTTDTVRRGVAVMGHGWGGHTFDTQGAAQGANQKRTAVEVQGGINRNLLVSAAAEDLDPLSGLPNLNGTAVSITGLPG